MTALRLAILLAAWASVAAAQAPETSLRPLIRGGAEGAEADAPPVPRPEEGEAVAEEEDGRGTPVLLGEGGIREASEETEVETGSSRMGEVVATDPAPTVPEAEEAAAEPTEAPEPGGGAGPEIAAEGRADGPLGMPDAEGEAAPAVADRVGPEDSPASAEAEGSGSGEEEASPGEEEVPALAGEQAPPADVAESAAPDLSEPPVIAETPAADTPRPDPRPAESDAAVAAAEPETPDADGLLVASLRPMLRPDGLDTTPPEPEPVLAGPVGTHEITVRGGLFGTSTRTIQVPAFADDGRTSVLVSIRPPTRPAGLEQRVRATATRTTPARVTQPGRRGQLCERAGILGDRLEPITGRSSGCGIPEPVRVREIDGIALTTPATINCDTARALQDWLNEAAVPIIGRTGGGLSNLRVVASYACRTRNGQAGARISEHATGGAIDIAGFGLVNGQELTVLGGFRSESQGAILRRLHASACGPFGTVLGPNSDRFHQDHFHFDTAAYRSGAYCR